MKKCTPTTIDGYEQVILSELFKGRATIKCTAHRMGLSVRSLQRELEALGLNHRQMVNAARMKLACQLLADPSEKVKNIAIKAGFTDSSNFSRAFRRQLGVTPKVWRASHVQ